MKYLLQILPPRLESRVATRQHQHKPAVPVKARTHNMPRPTKLVSPEIQKIEDAKESEILRLIGSCPSHIKEVNEACEKLKTHTAVGGFWGRIKYADGSVDGPVFNGFPSVRVKNTTEVSRRCREIEEYEKLSLALYELVNKASRLTRKGKSRAEIDVQIQKLLKNART